MVSSDSVVLQNCCHSLSFLATADYARQDEAMAALRSIFGSLRERLGDLAEKKHKITSTDETDGSVKDQDAREEVSLEKIDHLISLILRRLAVLAKRWPLLDLLDEGDSDDDAVVVVDQLCDRVFRLTSYELKIRKPLKHDEEEVTVAKIWNESNVSHAYVVDTVQASLDILLSTAGWTLRKVTAELDSTTDGSDHYDGKENPLLVVRKRVDSILALCFEQYYEDPDIISPENRNFSDKVQEIAGRAAGDLRVLFPRAFKLSVHRILREAALVKDNHLVGGFVRFIRQQKEKVRLNSVLIYSWFMRSFLPDEGDIFPAFHFRRHDRFLVYK
jgi:hypothetical protein